VNKQFLLERLPNIPKKGCLRRLILQMPQENSKEWLEAALNKNGINVPPSFWLDFESARAID